MGHINLITVSEWQASIACS